MAMNNGEDTKSAVTMVLVRGSQEGSVPLWSQLKSALVELIVGQGLQEHTRLPSEAELCSQYGVSRTVVREALNQLVHERLIYKLQGKGAFVAGRRDEQDFVGTRVGFSGELADKHKVGREILRQELEPATDRVQKMLRVEPGTPIVAIDRVLSVDGIPRLLVRWRMPEDLVPGLDQIPLYHRSLYDTLNRQYGITFDRADRWIEAVCAEEQDANLLDVTTATPLLGLESVAFSAQGRPIEYYTALYRTDRARLHIQINGLR
ncbi:GntR family transcriptional regulator [Chthonobacter albigriseus]|uniref:GntR family transcriptional regulator n=1 Tax=Chthonobacter albigriseus TaxID=1683161 RepID=UPI0019D55561|nr:GntR family transcriptional regulator [Chthonobacter albigriseus]